MCFSFHLTHGRRRAKCTEKAKMRVSDRKTANSYERMREREKRRAQKREGKLKITG